MAADGVELVLDEHYGVSLNARSAESGRNELAINRAIDARLAALNAKDFAAADKIRAELLEQGIQLMDAKNAAGERVTTWEVRR